MGTIWENVLGTIWENGYWELFGKMYWELFGKMYWELFGKMYWELFGKMYWELFGKMGTWCVHFASTKMRKKMKKEIKIKHFPFLTYPEEDKTMTKKELTIKALLTTTDKYSKIALDYATTEKSVAFYAHKLRKIDKTCLSHRKSSVNSDTVEKLLSKYKKVRK